jgi:hypothetical protein
LLQGTSATSVFDGDSDSGGAEPTEDEIRDGDDDDDDKEDDDENGDGDGGGAEPIEDESRDGDSGGAEPTLLNKARTASEVIPCDALWDLIFFGRGGSGGLTVLKEGLNSLMGRFY